MIAASPGGEQPSFAAYLFARATPAMASSNAGTLPDAAVAGTGQQAARDPTSTSFLRTTVSLDACLAVI